MVASSDLFVDGNSGADVPKCGTPSAFPSIQYAIDSELAVPVPASLLPTALTTKQVILYKEVSLFGSGVGTVINSRPPVNSAIQPGADKLTTLGGTPDPAIEVPGITVTFPGPDHPGLIRANNIVIEGFQITGGTVGGGIYVLDNGANMEIRNNLITGNQGQLGGGITIGIPGGANVNNTGIHIHRNQIYTNSGVNGGGGIILYDAAHDYRLRTTDPRQLQSRQWGRHQSCR